MQTRFQFTALSPVVFKKQHNEYKNITWAKQQVGPRSAYRLVKHRVASTYLKKETET